MGAGSTPAGAIRGRTATGAVSRLENGWALGPWGFDSLSFRLFVPAWSRWQDARLLTAKGRFEPCRRSLMPPWSNGDDAGPSTRKLRVRVPPGVLHHRLLAVGEQATPPVSGTGDRRFDSCRPDLDLRGRGAAVLASLMSSRPWVRIPPAHFGGVAQTCKSTRLSGERPPVRVRSSPLRGGRGVDGSIRGCDPRWRRFEPGRPPSTHADAEHRRAQQAVTLSPRAVVVRLHPSALAHFARGDVAQADERLACNEEDVGSTPTVSASPP